MNFCPQCGNKLLPAARFCPGCGTRLTTGQDAGSVSPPNASTARPVSAPKRSSLASDQHYPLSKGLFQRVKGIIISPASEWDRIGSEIPDAKGIMLGYVLVLALIPGIADFIYTALIGESVYGYRIRSVSGGIIQGIIQLVTALASVYLSALICNRMAVFFNGRNNYHRALQLIAYSMTPVWLAGFFNFLPSATIFKLVMLTIGGIYAIYLLYKGVPVIMQVPEHKALGYTLAIMIVCFVAMSGIGALLGLGAGLILKSI